MEPFYDARDGNLVFPTQPLCHQPKQLILHPSKYLTWGRTVFVVMAPTSDNLIDREDLRPYRGIRAAWIEDAFELALQFVHRLSWNFDSRNHFSTSASAPAQVVSDKVKPIRDMRDFRLFHLTFDTLLKNGHSP